MGAAGFFTGRGGLFFSAATAIATGPDVAGRGVGANDFVVAATDVAIAAPTAFDAVLPAGAAAGFATGADAAFFAGTGAGFAAATGFAAGAGFAAATGFDDLAAGFATGLAAGFGAGFAGVFAFATGLALAAGFDADFGAAFAGFAFAAGFAAFAAGLAPRAAGFTTFDFDAAGDFFFATARFAMNPLPALNRKRPARLARASLSRVAPGLRPSGRVL